MNPLLARQLRKHLGSAQAADPSLASFLASISAAYDELEGDKRLIEHTLEMTSEELNEANEKLRRESENKIQELSRYYLETLECHEGMILRVLRQGSRYIHTLCRGGLAKRLGFLPERVEGFEPADFLPPERAAALCRIYDRVWLGEECIFEDSSENDEIHYLARFRPMMAEGCVVELIVSAVEVTNLKRTQRELLAAKERAESADRAKSEFLAVMSHEIRTPLNAVLGFTSLLQTSKLSDDQLSWVDTISQSGRSLLALLNDILDFSKIEAGQLALTVAPSDLMDLLDGVHMMFNTKAGEKGLVFKVDVAPNVPRVINTDIVRLRQVLVNLVSNAIKFTHQGSVVVTIALAPVGLIGSQAASHQLRIRVSDTGIGIPDHLQNRLFKPFSQADSSTTRQYGGTGLGLAISQRLANALGGSIGFTSVVGKGSEFVVNLPLMSLVPPSKQAHRPAHSEVAKAADRPVFNCRVLVAEDHPHNRQLISRILGSYGIKPDLVEDGQLALEACQSADYDLIFMDVRMPRMDGLEATRAIRKALEGRPQPHIVAVTANAFDEEQRLCLEAGMDSVLLKPYVLSDLLAQLRRFAGGPTKA